MPSFDCQFWGLVHLFSSRRQAAGVSQLHAFAGLRHAVFRIASELGLRCGVHTICGHLQHALVPHPLPGWRHFASHHDFLCSEAGRSGKKGVTTTGHPKVHILHHGVQVCLDSSAEHLLFLRPPDRVRQLLDASKVPGGRSQRVHKDFLAFERHPPLPGLFPYAFQLDHGAKLGRAQIQFRE